MTQLSCSPVLKGPSEGLPVLAIINNIDYDTDTVDATGSLGTQVRVVVKRSGAVVETTPGELNNGDNQISITGPLQNGDVVCVQASNNGFATYDEDCHTIPTPLFGFVPVT